MKKRLTVLLFQTVIILVTVQCTSCNHGTSNKQAISNDQESIIAEIKNLEMERLQAGVTKNLSFFDSATASDYSQIDFDGIVLDKPAMLNRIKSSYAQLRSNEPTDMLIRVYGNTAILTAQANPKGTMKGKEFTDSIRYTRIYVKREGRWQVVLFQQTRINSHK